MEKKEYLEDLVSSINLELTTLKEKKNVVIWGLGEYAEKIVIYSDLLNYKISYYVDENRKGIFLGREIYSPKQIEWNTIDAVVISSFYKNKEIQEELIEKYKYIGLIVNLGNTKRSREFYKSDSREVLRIEDWYREELLRNQCFQNIYRGKKCFILGGGPSIKQVDLKKINEEVVFAVNDFFRLGPIVSIDHYVVADPYYWDTFVISKMKGRFFDSIKELEKYYPNINYWFPVQFSEKMRSIGEYWRNQFYFYPSRQWDKKIDYSVDLTKRIFERYSVIQYCIQLALYMGVKEIYLVGCEETGIFKVLENYMEDVEYDYAYNYPEDDLKILKNYLGEIEIYRHLQGFSNIYKGYREMSELCENQGVKLYTCAKRTLVKDVSYCDYYEAVNNA